MQNLATHWQTWRARQTRPRASEAPLRADLFSGDQLASHARTLASNHRIATQPHSNRLLARLDGNEERLRAFHHATLSANPGRRITPAAEWLLDNFYLIEEQMQLARRHLPRGYSRELPRLSEGPNAGFPRVYDVVLELIAHVDAQIDLGPLSGFVAAYQTAVSLKLGELWAIPIMLRLGLIENLQRITTRLTVGRFDRDLADLWVDRLQDMAENDPSFLVIIVADMARSDLPLSSSFVAEFYRRLPQQSPVLHLARNWLEQRLAEQGMSIEQLVEMESQSQAADQVSVSHSISSLRFLSTMDAKTFVESLSLVDRTLRTDPAAVYSAMDFRTRDRYRHAVEALVRHSRRSEGDIARAAIRLAETGAAEWGHAHRRAHVGYYLIDQGQATLERIVGVRWPWRTLVERGIRRWPLVFYVGGIGTLTLAAAAGFVARAAACGIGGWRLTLLGLTFLLCSSQLAVALVNWISMRLVKPRLLPRLDYSAGIPPDDRTMVAVPTLLSSPDEVDGLLDTLEIHHLANRDKHLHFALLTDFRDAAEEVLPSDKALIDRARAGIERLNRQYASEGPSLFYLFHRPRRWNAADGLWMGYERKRGKLAEFNRLLRNPNSGRFSEIVGDTSILPSIRYVITLDTDTELPREAARKLVGTMAHRLNRPVFDEVRGIVVQGYSILQPRVGVSLPSSGRSWFVRLFAGDVGIDPYTRAVSDVYQDLFQEGSFIGKGIYDVDAFGRAMEGRFPENTILSHDLLESCHGRSALVTDVALYEEYPSRYNVDSNRRHRWIRGDWQIMQWLLPRVPGTDVRRISNPLSGLSQWKIFDNLRRSLIPTALLLLLLGNWLLLPDLGSLGSLLVLAILVIPGVLAGLADACLKPDELVWSTHLWGVAGSAARQVGQVLLTLAFLPYDALISLDAIGRTLVNLLVTRRRLLEWQTSGDTARTSRTTLAGFVATMWIAPLTAAAVASWLGCRHPVLLFTAAPILSLWVAAPFIAWWISRPIRADAPDLSAAQRDFLRRIARKTWRYFETFVTARENWLPPDNFQEIPSPRIATRTSPTNMGLALLANLAARDFGFLAVGPLIERTEHTLATMGRLARHRGHFYNWYDTRTLSPLPPLYVSTVDSGNLAAHLLTHSSGLRELCDERILSQQVWCGMRDTVEIMRQLAVDDFGLGLLADDLAKGADTLTAGWALLEQVASHVGTMEAALATQSEELREWGDALRRNCQEHRDDLLFLAPWLVLPGLAISGLDPDPALLDRIPTLRGIADLEGLLAPMIEAARPSEDPLSEWSKAVHEAARRARGRLQALERLARQSEDMAAMDFTFLSDSGRNLFSIGYNVTERRLDSGVYDLLASEARVASYVAIAQGQVPLDHWFSLSRLLVPSPKGPILVSWSGSMFEYLMPLLVMPSYDNTLLERTCRTAVDQQIAYGRLRGVPWGISESGYNLTDVNLNYQYRAFGVPGLGLKRGLSGDLVIAPYASAMALMIAPGSACANLQRLSQEGQEGEYGFYEAVDFTPSRQPPDCVSTTIRSFMAHHQGMSLLAIASVLLDGPMQRRFMACPIFRAADLLLQERVPKVAASVYSRDLATEESRPVPGEVEPVMRVFTNPSPRTPDVHLLSNGRYHVAVSSAGGGYSRWGDLAVTRWREDGTRDCWGTFVYLRDVATGEFWSVAHQPVQHPARHYEAIFTQARAEFRQECSGLETHAEISVSPEDDVELWRIRLTNPSSVARVIEMTTYAEVVLAAQGADTTHPAFSNLSVQTEFVHSGSAILCNRRPRSTEERPPWMLHLLVTPNSGEGPTSCETDRSRFIGRGGSLAAPAALRTPGALSNTTGSVLDPIVSLRRTIALASNTTAVVNLALGVAGSRDAALALVEKYQNARMSDRAFDLAWTHSQVTLRHLNATEAEAQLYGRLSGALIYSDPGRRANPAVLRNNRRGQSGLWSYGISGDSPIILLRIGDPERIEIVRQLIQAHSYWRMKGLTVELVILNEDVSVYRQSMHDTITKLITSGLEAPMLDKPGGIFVRRLRQVSDEDRLLLQSVARIVLEDNDGTLAEQVERRSVMDPLIPALVPVRSASPEPNPPIRTHELLFANGLGGFTGDGREYVITLAPEQTTPAPWVNVLANPTFGTVISESGSAYTWGENAHEFRLTPWSNDAVQDTTGEALFLRDEETGQFWSPTPLPVRGATPYVIRHGFGYSVFEHTEHGIACEVSIFVSMDAAVKFTVVKVRNVSGRARRVTITGYWEWVLGDLRQKNLQHVQTEVDVKTGALLARNYFNTEFPDRIAFIDVNNATRTLTGDRREFLGRNGSLAQPAALRAIRLSGKVGAGMDPCGAVQIALDLPDGREKEAVFRLGIGRGTAEVQNLIRRFRGADAAGTALAGVRAYWNHTLGAVNVETPDPAVNVMANGWLLYQTLGCRLWGRTGFYQSGGAYGFRDQLQDVIALVHAEPGLTREHLLRAAARQFREGDVQHWWHPPGGHGVRTGFSDDYLWLPYATCRYVSCLSDFAVLDERIPFLEGRPLKPGEDAYYGLPNRSEESATLYEHGVRAIERGLKFGVHGLPLIGCGDWNDGMNRVGNQGRGESVWLAFFLYDVLCQFAPLARAHHDAPFADRCLAQARELQENIEKHAWDGQWYCRAYFDDGGPLGSRTNPECQIDSLPQSWSVISGAGNSLRSRQAMESADRRLVRRDVGLIQLFDPPFDKSPLNPGYIKGYIPGVRENGGQYTHGAIWMAIAYALLGDAERAWDLASLLNPIHHSRTPGQVATYKVEPYVLAADVYAVAPHTGRGGWTWYTGSAGWMYRLLLETLLGVNREGDRLRLAPCLPAAWQDCRIHYRYRRSLYHITIIRIPGACPGANTLLVDGQETAGTDVPLRDDGHEHAVELKICGPDERVRLR